MSRFIDGLMFCFNFIDRLDDPFIWGVFSGVCFWIFILAVIMTVGQLLWMWIKGKFEVSCCVGCGRRKGLK